MKWFEILKQRRIERGLTAEELAKLSDSSANAIRSMENGYGYASDDVVSRVQNYFLLGVRGRLNDKPTKKDDEEETKNEYGEVE